MSVPVPFRPAVVDISHRLPQPRYWWERHLSIGGAIYKFGGMVFAFILGLMAGQVVERILWLTMGR
jgi:hypothetical protein